MAGDVATRVQALQRREAEMSGAIATLTSSLDLSGQSIASLEEAVDVANKAKALLESYAVDQQAELKVAVEGLVTRGLQTVFEERLEFRMNFTTLRDQPDVSFAVVSYIDDEPFEMDIPNSFGGGLAVVCAVLLRVIVLRYLVEHGRVDPILVLDEPLAALSPNYSETNAENLRTRMAMFLRTVADELGVQLVLVTHEPDYGDYADVHHVFSGGLGADTKVVAGATRVDD